MKKLVLTALISAFTFNQANAHGVAGNRVFPATLEIEDPAVEDELTLPQFEALKQQNEDGETNWNRQYSFEYAKRITEDFGLSVAGTYVDEQNSGSGFDNFAVAAKYEFYKNAEHEILMSAGIDWDIGGTGSDVIGAEHFSSITPQVFFGKGMGDLPDSVSFLKPFALTGQIGVGFPSSIDVADEKNPTTFNYGFSLQYSLPYLQQHVKDIGLGAPFNNLIPLVEVNFKTPFAHNDNNATTGTINPGIIWLGESTQFGVEAVIPVNNSSGRGVGVLAQMHFFLDDVFPTTLGKPIF